MSALEALLVVQEHDTTVEQLRYRRTNLPQRAELDALRREQVATDAALASVQARHDTLVRDEQRLDDEASTHEVKAADMEKRLYSGTVTAPKELQSMQAEVEQFRRLRDQIEDRELELMEQREVIDADLERLRVQHVEQVARAATLAEQIGAAEVEIDALLAAELAARAESATPVSAEMLGVYEDRRAKAKGVGVARLIGLTCQGCHLTVPAAEADALRHGPPDTLAFCDNCGAILVAS